MLAETESALSRLMRGRDMTRAIQGHVTGIEIALRGSRQHPEAGVHMHSIIHLHADYFSKESDLYLDQPRLVALWRQALRADYNPICHITAVPPGEGVRGTLIEVLKYAVAPHKLFARGSNIPVDPVVAAYLVDALYKRRLCRFSGSFSRPRTSRARKTQGEDHD